MKLCFGSSSPYFKIVNNQLERLQVAYTEDILHVESQQYSDKYTKFKIGIETQEKEVNILQRFVPQIIFVSSKHTLYQKLYSSEDGNF